MWPLYIFLGVITGVASGLFGIGGGLILIPSLVYFFNLTQHQAQGTTLAIMIPPIGLLAALRYYKAGNVNLPMTIFICLGFFIGGLIGADFAHKMSDQILKKVFGFIMLGFSLKMILGK